MVRVHEAVAEVSLPRLDQVRTLIVLVPGGVVDPRTTKRHCIMRGIPACDCVHTSIPVRVRSTVLLTWSEQVELLFTQGVTLGASLFSRSQYQSDIPSRHRYSGGWRSYRSLLLSLLSAFFSPTMESDIVAPFPHFASCFALSLGC